MLSDTNDTCMCMAHRGGPLGQLKESALEAICEGELKYRMLIEYIPAITYIAAIDEHSSTLYTSPQIETMLGFSQTEWMADPVLWQKQILPDDRRYVLDELARLHGGATPRPCEYRMLTRDGRIVWFRDETAVRYSESGQPLFLYGVMLDITERKRLEAELTQTQRQLIESVREKFNERELAVLRLVQEGYTDRQISQELAIAERTVGYCLQGLYTKLGVKKRVAAVREATRLHLLDE
ncbi:MAG: PAS domain-containing protein [Roseiflexaceae bacterium]